MKKAELRRRIEFLEARLDATQKLVAEQATERSLRRAWALGPVTGYHVPDPADTAKVGDPDPTTGDGGRDCPALDTQWACTRASGHGGQHVAGDNRTVVAVWAADPDRDDPLPDDWTHTCPRCLAKVEALPPRRICDECETDVGTRLVPYVGMTIRGEYAVAHLPDGAVLQWWRSSTAALRTIGKPMADSSRWPQARGVHPIDTYRIVSLPGDDDVVAAVIHDADCPGGRCSCPGADVEQAERDRTAAIEGATTTLRAHVRLFTDFRIDCSCGWQGDRRRASDHEEHARHVAEQLAAVGALGDTEPVAARPVLIDRDGDEWWPSIGGEYVHRDDSLTGTRDVVDAKFGPVIEKAIES